MKKSMFKRATALALVVMMLVTACITYTASAATLTITAAPAESEGTSVRDDSASDFAVLTDGVKSGSHNSGLSFNTNGSNLWTEYTLSYSEATTIDTIKVYGFTSGTSWALADSADGYSFAVDGAEVSISNVAFDTTDEKYPVATITLATAVTTTSAVLSIKNAAYACAVFEIETSGAAAPDVPSEDPSTDVPSEDPSTDVPSEDPSTDVPSEDPSTDVPSEDPSTDVPSEDPSTDVSSEEPSEEPSTLNAFTTTIGIGDNVFTAKEDGNVVAAAPNGTDSQKWTFEEQEDGTYKITNVATGKVLDVAGAVDADGTNVATYDSNDSAAQRFNVIFQNAEKTLISLKPCCSNTQAIDCDAGSLNVQTWDYSAENPNQKFAITMEGGVIPPVEPPVEPEKPTEVNYAKDKNYTTEGNFLGGKEDDGKILTDGFTPDAEIGSQTVAFMGTGKTNVITIDLGKKYTDISKIVVGGVIVNGNRQYGAVTLEVSSNGSSFKQVNASVAEEAIGESAAKNYVYTLDKVTSARYVKITLVSKDYVLALSEIQVIGSGSNAPVNPDNPEEPGDAGFAVVALLAVISLAGAVVVAKKRSI